MGRNLLKAGYELIGPQPQPGRRSTNWSAEGARRRSSPREVGRAVDVVITMLPDSPDVEAVLRGENGVLAGMPPARSSST